MASYSNNTSRSSSSYSQDPYYKQSASTSRDPHYNSYRSPTAQGYVKGTVTRGNTVVHNEHSRGYNKNDPRVEYVDSSAYGSGKRYYN